MYLYHMQNLNLMKKKLGHKAEKSDINYMAYW